MAVHVVNFVAAGTCLFFSLLIFIFLRALKAERTFFFLGAYFLLLSVISSLHALLLAYPLSPLVRELLILDRVLGLSSGFLILVFVRKLKPGFPGKVPARSAYVLLAVLLAVAVIDLVFAPGLLFAVRGSRAVVQPLYRFVYVPFSFLGLGGLALLIHLVYRSAGGNSRRLLGTLSAGMFCLLPLEYWDLLNCVTREDLLGEPVYLYSVGVLAFLIFIAAFFIRLVTPRLAPAGPADAATVRTIGVDEESLILGQIYDKVVAATRSRKLYLYEELTAEALARRINESAADVSRAINLCTGNNFTRFLNGFRVAELKKLLSDPQQTEPIASLGIRAGFNSKTSTNRVFFQFVGLTPREFRRRALHGHPVDFSAASGRLHP